MYFFRRFWLACCLCMAAPLPPAASAGLPLATQEVYRINGYKKNLLGEWEKIPLKVRVTPQFGGERIELIAYLMPFVGWQEANYCMINRTNSALDADAYDTFDYKVFCGGMIIYFNF